jgi:hypothetical protein
MPEIEVPAFTPLLSRLAGMVVRLSKDKAVPVYLA